jgi:hypothetical protein
MKQVAPTFLNEPILSPTQYLDVYTMDATSNYGATWVKRPFLNAGNAVRRSRGMPAQDLARR